MQYNQQAKLHRDVAALIMLGEVYSYFGNWSYLYCTNNIKKGAFQNIINKGLSLQFLLGSSSQELTNWRTCRSSSEGLIAMQFEIGPNLHSIRPDTLSKRQKWRFLEKIMFSSICQQNWRVDELEEALMAIHFKIGPNLHSIRQDTYLKERNTVFRKIFFSSVSSTILTSCRIDGFDEALLID